MKKFAPILLLLALFVMAAPQAKAQLQFYNGTPCAVRVLGGFNFTPNPCTGNQCQTGWISVPAGAFVTIPGVSTTPCLSPFPPPGANFFGFKLLVSATSGTSVDICNTATSSILDCQGNLRTVQIFNFNLGAIY